MNMKNTRRSGMALQLEYVNEAVILKSKTAVVRLRVTQHEHDLLMQTAHKHNLTFSEYARKALLKELIIQDTYIEG